MTYAIVEIQGKQHRLTVGDKLEVDRLSQNEGDQVTFDRVLLFSDGDQIEIGTPVLPYLVTAKVESHSRGKKIRVATYKAKSRFRKVKGHRQDLSTIVIEKIAKAAAAKPSPASTSKPAKKSPAQA